MRFAWKTLVALGALLVVLAFGMDTAVQTGHGRVHNIGLLDQRQLLLILGCTLFLAGVVLFAVVKMKETPEEEQAERAAAAEAMSRAQANAARAVGKVGNLARATRFAIERVVLVVGGVLFTLCLLFPPRLVEDWDANGAKSTSVTYAPRSGSEEPVVWELLIAELAVVLTATAIAYRFARRRT